MASVIGTMHTNDFPSDVRKNDRVNEAIHRLRQVAPLFTITREKLKLEAAQDVKYITFEDREVKMDGDLYGYSAGSAGALAATDVDLYIASAEDFMKVGDVLAVHTYQDDETNLYVNSNATRLAMGENMIVSALDGSHVTVERNNGDTTVSTYNATTSGATYRLKYQRIGAAEPEGATSREAKMHKLESKYNYIQRFEASFAYTEEVKLTQTFGTSEAIREKKNTWIEMIRGIEGSLIRGQRREGSSAGKKRRTTGGVLWHLDTTDSDTGVNAYSSTYDLVTGDHTARLWRPAGDFSLQSFDKFVAYSCKNGNRKKLAMHGFDFMRQLQYVWDGKLRMERSDKEYGVVTHAYESSGGRLEFMYNPDLDAWDERGLICLDLDYIKLKGMKDIKFRRIHEIDGAGGYTEDKSGWTALLGLKLTNVPAHSALFGLNNIAG